MNKENTLQNKEKIGIATNYMYTQICEGQEKNQSYYSKEDIFNHATNGI